MELKYTIYLTETVTRTAKTEVKIEGDYREAERVAQARIGELVWSDPVKTVKMITAENTAAMRSIGYITISIICLIVICISIWRCYQ